MAPIADPPSTQASSRAASANARFLGPSRNPPNSGSCKTELIPAASKASRSAAFSGVHSWVWRPPSATNRATGPRATARADCTSICRSSRAANRHMIWRASSPGSVLSPGFEALLGCDLLMTDYPLRAPGPRQRQQVRDVAHGARAPAA